MDERSKTFNECVRRGDFAGAALQSGALMKYAQDAQKAYTRVMNDYMGNQPSQKGMGAEMPGTDAGHLSGSGGLANPPDQGIEEPSFKGMPSNVADYDWMNPYPDSDNEGPESQSVPGGSGSLPKVPGGVQSGGTS